MDSVYWIAFHVFPVTADATLEDAAALERRVALLLAEPVPRMHDFGG